MVLTQVPAAVEAIREKQVQRNIAAASGILAGLVLEKDVIRKILRSEIMRESVIYQEILKEGEARGETRATRKLALKLLLTGMSLEQIAQLTELSIKQVKSLQTEIQE